MSDGAGAEATRADAVWSDPDAGFGARGLTLGPVEAFLDPAHHRLHEDVLGFCETRLRGRPDPEVDQDARARALELAGLMGAAGLFEPIRAGDVRGCLVIREALAWWSPLADAVFALQGLSVTPGLIAGVDPGGWRDRALGGDAVGAFAMTEWAARLGRRGDGDDSCAHRWRL